MYVIEVDGVVHAMLITHVDDLIWAVQPEYAHHMKAILKEFAVNEEKTKKNDFRFCGKEIKRLPSGNILVTCKDATECIGPIKYSAEGRRMSDLASQAEVAQMRSVIGSLGWIARQCRPDLSYDVSRGQSVVSKATVKDLKEANQALQQAKEFSERGLIFEAYAVSWLDMMVVTVTDASFANETVYEPDGTDEAASNAESIHGAIGGSKDPDP